MNHFVKSVWLGALVAPPRWKSVVTHNLLSSLLIAIVLFLGVVAISGKNMYFNNVQFMLLCWFLTMAVNIVLPSKKVKLKLDGKTLYFFLYNTSCKWKYSDEKSFPAVMRVFVKENGKLNKAGNNLKIIGFDTSILKSGFFLAKLRNTERLLFGNHYDICGKPMLLGHKIANYAFLSTSRRKESILNILHGEKVISLHFCQSVFVPDDVYITPLGVKYKQIAGADEDCLEGFSPNKCSGQFIFVKNGEELHLLKLFNYDGIPAVYAVLTDWFVLSNYSKKVKCYYKLKTDKGGYYLDKKSPLN